MEPDGVSSATTAVLGWLLSTGSATVAVLIVGYLCRNLIETRLKRAVQNEFDEKLELFRDDLKRKEAELQAVRSGALSALQAWRIAVDKRRLEAIDQLWEAFYEQYSARAPVILLQRVKIKQVLAEAPKDPALQKLFAAFSALEKKDLKNEGWRARPFVSQLSWAYFSAYQAICSVAMILLIQLRSGLEGDFVKHEALLGMVSAVLPHQKQFVEAHGFEGAAVLLDEIEALFLREVARMLQGNEEGPADVARAAAITQAAEAVQSDLQAAKRRA